MSRTRWVTNSVSHEYCAVFGLWERILRVLHESCDLYISRELRTQCVTNVAPSLAFDKELSEYPINHVTYTHHELNKSRIQRVTNSMRPERGAFFGFWEGIQQVPHPCEYHKLSEFVPYKDDVTYTHHTLNESPTWRLLCMLTRKRANTHESRHL